MAGLLDFALGFGAGAAGGFVEQKKADLEAQRQANLARLQAQYKGEAEYEQARRIATMARSTDPFDRDVAGLMGFKPTESDLSQKGKEFRDYLKAANIPEDSDLARQIAGPFFLGTSAEDPADNIIPHKDEYTQRMYYYNKKTGEGFEFRGGTMVPVSSEMQQSFRRTYGFTDRGQQTETRALEPAPAPAPAPPPMLARATPTEAMAVQPTPAQPSTERVDVSYAITDEAKSELEQFLGYPIADDVSLFDYSSAIAGPFDRSIGFVSRFNVLGDIIDALGGERMADASKQAVDASSFLQRYMAQAYAYNAEGRKNIEDIKIGKQLLSGTGTGLSGWFMRDEDAHESLLRIRNFLITDVKQAYNKSQSRTLPAAARKEADSFLANAAPLLPILNAYIGGYLVSNTGAKPPGSSETKPITQWTIEEIMQINNLSAAEKLERYNPEQRNAISIWGAELKRRLQR